MRVALAALVACVGCGKELNPKFCAAHPDDDRCTAVDPDADVDAEEVSNLPVAHLSAAIEAMLTSDADITLDASSLAGVIDTTNGTITPAWPGAVILPDVAQENGPNVMVVQVGSLDIPLAVDYLDIEGDKPLIIVATRTISLGARLNGSGDALVAGPGGFASAKGTGAGGAGMHSSVAADGGGGGGSFATAGGAGGGPMGGAAGATYGSAMTLTGGSGGGRASAGTCTVEGGAGGGAIQLTALVSIEIVGTGTGRISVGGSGGQGGASSCGTMGSGGGGGGAGGMIFLESPLITGDGALGALGGGGGEGASTGGSIAGMAGGEAGSTTAGTGGANAGTGGDGGSAALSGAGSPGNNGELEGNGGGGGGGAGYIFLKTTGPAPASLQINPPPTSA